MGENYIVQLNNGSIRIFRNKKNVGTIQLDTLSKYGFKEKNLFWKEGGVPTIDADMFDTFRGDIRWIFVRTEKRIFKIYVDIFQSFKKEINYGEWGRQYYVPKEYWKIRDKKGSYDELSQEKLLV